MNGEHEPLLHFSEDPSISRFEPHVPATNPAQAPAVWAIDAGVELRFVEDLSPFWSAVMATGLPFSGVRLRNASMRGWEHA